MKMVCTSTPAFDSDRNSYRKLALISLSHPVLLHGILSVSTGHMHNYGRADDRLLSSRQSRALTSLRAALNAFQMTSEGAPTTREPDPFSRSTGVFSVLSPRGVTLAAIMMQTSSVLMTGIGSVEVHMKCALHFIRDLGYMDHGPPAHSVFMRLLVQRFAMVDVVLAHLRFRRPLAPLDFYMYRPHEDLDSSEPAFREIQGCPQRVLCFMAHIAVLAADLVQGNSPPDQVQAEAYALETSMRAWGHRSHEAMSGSRAAVSPLLPQETQSSPAEQLVLLEVVCECFYWTAHLLLMRRVFLDATTTARVQLIRRHLFRLMDSIPAGCGPDSSLPFPFYMAAREAVAYEDREWVRRKHVAWLDIYRDRSREYMMASTERIWEKRMAMGEVAPDGVEPWDAPFEVFIREMDHQASYFMF